MRDDIWRNAERIYRRLEGTLQRYGEEAEFDETEFRWIESGTSISWTRNGNGCQRAGDIDYADVTVG